MFSGTEPVGIVPILYKFVQVTLDRMGPFKSLGW
jgi:hypothetical protein